MIKFIKTIFKKKEKVESHNYNLTFRPCLHKEFNNMFVLYSKQVKNSNMVYPMFVQLRIFLSLQINAGKMNAEEATDLIYKFFSAQNISIPEIIKMDLKMWQEAWDKS